METDELLNILFGNKVQEHKYETITNVSKENIGFLIDNQGNMEREKNGEHKNTRAIVVSGEKFPLRLTISKCSTVLCCNRGGPSSSEKKFLSCPVVQLVFLSSQQYTVGYMQGM